MEQRVLDKLHKSEQEILDHVVDICNKHNLEYYLIGGTLLGAVRHGGFIPWDDDLDIAMPREDYNKFVKKYYKEMDERFLLDCYNVNNKYLNCFAKVRLKNTIFEEAAQKNYNGHKGIWIDIFPLDKSSNEKIANIQKKIVEKIHIIMRIKGKIHTNNKFGMFLINKVFCFINNNFWGYLQEKIMMIQNKNGVNYINFGSQYGIKKQIHLVDKFFPTTEVEFEKKKYKAPNDYNSVLNKIYGDYMKLPPIEKRITHNPLRIKFEDGEEIIFDE